MKSQPICLSYPRQKYCESSVLWIASHFGCVIFFFFFVIVISVSESNIKRISWSFSFHASSGFDTTNLTLQI